MSSENSPNPVEESARQKLREAISSFGRPICNDARLCEAILRDLCPQARREIFLLVSAQRENVAVDLLSRNGHPEDALIDTLVRRLEQNLGLSNEPAKWSVESWRAALDSNPGLHLHPKPVPIYPGGETSFSSRRRPTSAPGTLDWPWISTCITATFAAFAALSVLVTVALWRNLNSWQAVAFQSIALLIGLTISFGLELLALRSFSQLSAPDYRAWGRKVSWPLIAALAVLILLPCVPAGALLVWTVQWITYTPPAPSAVFFHAGRAIESLILVVFLIMWVRSMMIVVARVAGPIHPDW